MSAVDAPAPYVSVVITSYNYARYIGEAIDSVLEQTYSGREIIVVDDGSTDDTPSVLSTYGDRIKCIYQENQGKSAALNRGIAASSGQVLAFLDSDDAWVPLSLQARVDALRSDPEVGVVYGRAAVMDENGNELRYSVGSPLRFPENALLSELYCNAIPFLTVAIRRSCLDRAGGAFSREFGASNDWELYLRLARVCGFRFLDRTLARYRIHSSNWSGDPQVMSREMTRVVERTLAVQDLPAQVVRYRPTIYRNLYTHIGLGFEGVGAWGKALEHFARAVRVSSNPVSAAARIAYLVLVRRLNRTWAGAALVSGMAGAKERLNSLGSGSARGGE